MHFLFFVILDPTLAFTTNRTEITIEPDIIDTTTGISTTGLTIEIQEISNSSQSGPGAQAPKITENQVGAVGEEPKDEFDSDKSR